MLASSGSESGESMSNEHRPRKQPHRRRKRTAAEKRARREQKKQFKTIMINGKQKRVPVPPLIDGLPVEEFLARNADPIWLHENGLWELMTTDDECDDAEADGPGELKRSNPLNL
jgi:hypothetical protein